ncbi:MAG TPA: septum formation initiator family protein [Candidatus Avacidaminococcus intestinavium]|uniref:Septum formation initiator family protein n=1 Tax=Candidatus Avacidaminococcus intestinavium TaxID=2840684 RepID=A0A9D1SKQ6_9FIRM|nr:septum formation initiator family protein [Candidatus Avacidaminococcus intestinavium]
MVRKKRGINGFKLLLMLVIACFLLALAYKEFGIYKLNQEMLKTQQKIEALEAEQKALSEERLRLDDPKYIEKLAREEHNMVGKDEVPLFIIEEEAPVEGKKPIEEGK